MRYAFWILTVMSLIPSAFAETQSPSPKTYDGIDQVMAIVEVDPDSIEEFQRAARRITAPTRLEPGCLSYDFHQNLDKPNEFITYETWGSRAAAEAHLTMPHMEAFFVDVKPFGFKLKSLTHSKKLFRDLNVNDRQEDK